VRVWCEDSEHEAFARCLLADVFGIERRAIDVNKARMERAPLAIGLCVATRKKSCPRTVGLVIKWG